MTTLATSCADSLEIWDPQPPGTFTACPGLLWDYHLVVFRQYQITYKLWEFHLG